MKTVIVSGYMNPLHTGHLSLFKAAANLGDRLNLGNYKLVKRLEQTFFMYVILTGHLEAPR